MLYFFLVVLFSWWVAKAFGRYWSQPLSTDISYSFGDYENGIEFPLITLCQNIHSQSNPILDKCQNKTKNFKSAIENCVKNDENFRVNDFLNSLTVEKTNVVFSTNLWKNSEFINLDNLVWSTVFHNVFGKCFTMDLSKTKDFRFVPYDEETRHTGRIDSKFSLIFKSNIIFELL